MRRFIVLITLVSLLCVFLSLDALLAAENKLLLANLAALDGYKAKIEEAYKTLPQIDSKSADLVSQALARIKATRMFLVKNPKAKRTQNMLAACELLMEMSVLQIKTMSNEYAIQKLGARRDSVQQELKSTLEKIKLIQEKIGNIERGHVSKFRADLAKERRKAEEQWEEAKTRFSELESELIQVRNEARRTVITMSDLLFGFDKHELTSALEISLAKIAGILSVFRELHIRIEGHTDNKGSEEYNQKLSEKRANNVKDFLIGQGIDPARLTAVGYNFSRPVASNDTREGRQKNRRVELVIERNDYK
ncbi:MAG: OmpA family protein [Deltaproteobacteria bacterium]|nr:OmpA family protein [Deltaproteobacteria bacterium]